MTYVKWVAIKGKGHGIFSLGGIEPLIPFLNFSNALSEVVN